MVTIKEVAKYAKVSTATVSRVISNSEAVSENTKKKVLKAIEDLNYHPNVLARNLRKMNTRNILVVVPDITNPFFSKILRGIENIALDNGYQVLLGDTKNSVELEEKYLDNLKNKTADGAILLTAKIKPEKIKILNQKFSLVVACEYFKGVNIPTISIDNISSARKATEHLVKLGHRRIAHISGPFNQIQSRDRLKGYKQAVNEYNLDDDTELIQEGDYSYKTGYELGEKLLTLEEIPTAIFAANDEMAIGAIKAIKNNGLTVPKDISVVGFDDIPLANIYEPSLTTISQKTFKMGIHAMEMLLKILKGNKIDKYQEIITSNLIVRDSCGANDKLKMR